MFNGCHLSSGGPPAKSKPFAALLAVVALVGMSGIILTGQAHGASVSSGDAASATEQEDGDAKGAGTFGGWLKSKFSFFDRGARGVVEDGVDPEGGETRPGESGAEMPLVTSDEPSGLSGEDEGVAARGAEEKKQGLGARLFGFLSFSGETGDGDQEAVDGEVERWGRVIGENERSNKYVVTEEDIPLYDHGPLQLQPVSIYLSSGQMVSVIKWRRGWSDVELENGERGTVATDVLRKAKASDFPVEPMAELPEELGGGYVDAALPDMLPLLEPVPLPEMSEFDGAGDASGESGGEMLASPLLLPPLPE